MKELQTRDLLCDSGNLKALKALYWGRVREADRLVGEVIGFLQRHGLEEITTVMITGDHGQLLGESFGKRKPIYGHGPILKEKALHVPLIVRAPHPREPLRVETRVGLIDLAPTMLELLGIEQPRLGQGESLLPFLEGRNRDSGRYVAEVRLVDPESNKKVRGDRIAIYENRMKVIFPDRKVYDLSRPEPDTKPMAGAKHQELIDRLSGLASSFLDYKGAKSNKMPGDLSKDDLEELRALGYL
ncbi:MAG: sulfatase-like hydrolase/transferase [Planctomycetes bacterium]|nr:sulfatase-like hydrolase/transferase [Planctomycetota bacterium]